MVSYLLSLIPILFDVPNNSLNHFATIFPQLNFIFLYLNVNYFVNIFVPIDLIWSGSV